MRVERFAARLLATRILADYTPFQVIPDSISTGSAAVIQANADRNLLLGILAHQNAFISRDSLFVGMQAWLHDKARSLAEILQNQGALDAQRRQLLEALVEQHVQQHGGDPAKSLQEVSPASSVRHDLVQLPDPDLQSSLVHLFQASNDENLLRTRTIAGTPTSAGTRFLRLRPHAKGGLGEVFVALDSELNREVALKEIQERRADESESRARFLMEAEITGGLEHPGIVPVYGLGTYADGRPFYAMRFIRGDSLMEAIQKYHKPPGEASNSGGPERNLQLRNLLRRLIDVCNALQYAHDRGVLHRDLKPGNIMLGKYGETLVVDWGLAKAAGNVNRGTPEAPASDAEPGTLALGVAEAPLLPVSGSGVAETVAGSAIGTPAFMSPEQAVGRLDLIGPASDVYGLGATLYCLLTGRAPFKGDVAEILKKVGQGDFPWPSKVKPGISPALEAICLKAMAMRPQDRYGAPRELSDDLEQWLADEPVQAWPEPWSVKTGRWMRRHKALVSGAAAALFVGIVALSAGLLWYQDEQNRRAADQALRRMEAARRQAEADRKQALSEAAIRNALSQAKQARQDLNAILQEPGGVFRLLNDPARWKALIGVARASLDRARALVATADQGVDPQLTEEAANLDASLAHDEADRLLAVRLEKIRMDKATIVDGKFDEARAAEDYPGAFAEANLTVLGEKPAAVAVRLHSSPIKEQMVAALDDWAGASFRLGQKGIAKQLLDVGRAATPDSTWGNRLRQIETWRDQHALTELVTDAPAAALSPPLLQLIGTLLGQDHPLKATWCRQAQAQHPTDFWLNLDLGNALLKTDPVESAGFYRVALAIRPGSSAAYYCLGAALSAQKKLPEAIAAYHKAIDLDPKCAQAYHNLGVDLSAQKKLPEAIAAFQKAIDLDPTSALAYNGLGSVLTDQKKLPEAIAACLKAIDINPKYALAYNNLGNAYFAQKELPEAVAAYEKAIDLNPKLALALNNLGAALEGQKKLAEATTAYQKAIEIDPKNAAVHNNLGSVLYAQKKLAEAITSFRKSIELDPINPRAYSNLGIALRGQNKLPEAIAACQKAIELDPKYSNAHHNLGIALSAQKKLPEALAAFQNAIELDPNYPQSRFGLGFAQFLKGSFSEGAANLQKALNLLPPMHPLRADWLKLLKMSQQMQALEKRVPAVLDGTAHAAPGELLEMAWMCQEYQKRYVTAVQLYRLAFDAKPGLADDKTRHYYNAACSAALGGTGHGEDAAKLTASEKAKFRSEARTWLQACLDLYANQAKDGKAAMAQIVARLSHWQADADLAGVRDTKLLAGLPEREGEAWRKLWEAVAALLKEARGE